MNLKTVEEHEIKKGSSFMISRIYVHLSITVNISAKNWNLYVVSV